MAKKKTKVASSAAKSETPKQEVSIIDGFVISGEELIPLEPNFTTNEALAERSFRSVTDLETLFVKNAHVLFGDKMVVVQVKKESVFGPDLRAPLIMLDFNNPDRLRFFILDVYNGSPEFYASVFPRVSELFYFLKKEEGKDSLFEYLTKDKVVLKMANVLVTHDPIDTLKACLKRFEGIYLITPEQIQEVEKLKEVYTETWSKVKHVSVVKLSGRKNSYLTFFPGLNEVLWDAKKRSRSDRPVLAESDHFDKCTPEIFEAYTTIKTALMEANPNITTNVQRYYVAFKKQRNAVIFLISKKCLSIVTMMPLEKVKKVIKKHTIKPLTEKVQKFYGGDCCMVKVENSEHLEEVLKVLRGIVKE